MPSKLLAKLMKSIDQVNSKSEPNDINRGAKQ
ncbi:hypothetical protein vBAspATola_04 [Aeromonas phage vB_AspA_Tola]|nr:hypothetical protein vBAspATola_04 [Aeromonas phage vB_AspA_Tola]